MGIGAAMAGGNPSQGRNSDDYYPTPVECTIGFLEKELPYIIAHGRQVIEPACGDGAMVNVMKDHGLDVQCFDLVDRGLGTTGVDYLKDNTLKDIPVITNPPFNLAAAFIRRALEDNHAPYLALLLKATYWHAASRLALFEEHIPSVVYPMTWRPDFMKRGAPTLEMCWTVWDINREGDTRYIPLRKPRAA